MTGRIDRLPENYLVNEMNSIDAELRELHVGAQVLEAKMYEWVSAYDVDIAGTYFPIPAGSVWFTLSVIVTSVDSSPFLSSTAYKAWYGSSGVPYEDNGKTGIGITAGTLPGNDATTVEHWYRYWARSSISTTTLYFKLWVYSTSPVNVTMSMV